MATDNSTVKIELAKKLKNYETARSSQQAVRDERIPDLSFARWSQTGDDMSEACTTQFVGEFNIISRERKQVQAEFRQNEVEVKFRSKNKDNDDLDDFMQRAYRTDRRLSKSRQCFHIAQDDSMDCGFGAWRLHTEDEDSEDVLSTNQGVRRSPIPEAIRRVWFDPNSKLYDKSDAKFCCVINSFTEQGYKNWLADNDLEEISTLSFDGPTTSIYEWHYGSPMQYPLYSGDVKNINLLEYYEIKEEVVTFWLYLGIDENGQEKIEPVKESVAKESGYPAPFRKKKVTKQYCMKTITNGIDILLESRVPGGMIPIIPMYGERNFVDGVENFYGIVKAAKDPQKLINAAYNYLTSLMMNSPVPKPVYDPLEIEGYESDYQDANNHRLAYLRKNKYFTDETGQTLQFQTEYTQPPQVPPAVGQLLAALPALTDSILNPGVTEDSFSSQMSGVALVQVKEQIGVMRYILLDNWNESMRRDAEVYAAMKAEVTDTTRQVTLTNKDGTTVDGIANESFFDARQMQVVVRNQIHNAKFHVYSSIGPSHQSQRDAALANLKEIFQTLPSGDPMQQVVLLSILAKQDGEGLEELNKAARFQLLTLGIPGIEPQTREEKEFVMQMQMAKQSQPPSLEEQILVMQEDTRNKQAMAQVLSQQNAAQRNQIDAFKAQTGAQNDQAKTQIDMFNAQTKRGDMQINAAEAEATIDNKNMDTLKKGVDAQLSQADLIEKEMRQRIASMDIRQLAQILR